MLDGVVQNLTNRSAAMLLSIEGQLDRLMKVWLLFAGLASALRIVSSNSGGAPTDLGTLLPYLCLIFAPMASMALALRWFRLGQDMPQPATRLARLGRWQSLSGADAQAQPLFGPKGIMVSLLIGMLLNVPVRALEYLASIPALAGTVPPWFATLHMLMTLDVVLFTSLYTVAFAAALRCVPLFPRLLVTIWACDVAMQLMIAALVAGTPGLPGDVGSALNTLLDGNVKKVLISAALWLPYLLLSRRVNITYRHRAAV